MCRFYYHSSFTWVLSMMFSYRDWYTVAYFKLDSRKRRYQIITFAQRKKRNQKIHIKKRTANNEWSISFIQLNKILLNVTECFRIKEDEEKNFQFDRIFLVCLFNSNHIEDVNTIFDCRLGWMLSVLYTDFCLHSSKYIEFFFPIFMWLLPIWNRFYGLFARFNFSIDPIFHSKSKHEI